MCIIKLTQIGLIVKLEFLEYSQVMVPNIPVFYGKSTSDICRYKLQYTQNFVNWHCTSLFYFGIFQNNELFFFIGAVVILKFEYDSEVKIASSWGQVELLYVSDLTNHNFFMRSRFRFNLAWPQLNGEFEVFH